MSGRRDLNEDEIADLKEAFAIFDANGDGKITIKFVFCHCALPVPALRWTRIVFCVAEQEKIIYSFLTSKYIDIIQRYHRSKRAQRSDEIFRSNPIQERDQGDDQFRRW